MNFQNFSYYRVLHWTLYSLCQLFLTFVQSNFYSVENLRTISSDRTSEDESFSLITSWKIKIYLQTNILRYSFHTNTGSAVAAFCKLILTQLYMMENLFLLLSTPFLVINITLSNMHLPRLEHYLSFSIHLPFLILIFFTNARSLFM